jgi:hypothetical protein
VPLAAGNCRPSFSRCIRLNPAFHGACRVDLARSGGFLQHDPEKHALGLDPGVDTGFPSRQTRSVCAEIMLKQRDEIMIRSNRFMI